MITTVEIAERVNISRRSVLRKHGIDAYYIKEERIPNHTGRPIKYYDTKVLGLWNQDCEIIIPKPQKLRKERDDYGLPRDPHSWNREERMNLLNIIVSHTKELWLSQARENNVFQCCLDACTEYTNINGIIEDFHAPGKLKKERKMARNYIYDIAVYFYQKFIVRNDSIHKGFFFKDNWLTEHRKIYNKRGTNDRMPKNRWDYLSLFHDYNLIEKGVGAGDLWVIDGSDLDSWVLVDGKPTKVKYIKVMCGITRFPLLVKPVTGESIEEIIKVIAQTYLLYGVPKYGIVLDNSRTFRSTAIQYLLRCLYSLEELNEFGTAEWRRAIFEHEKTAPIYYNIPNRPQYKFKGMLERSFKSDDKFSSSFNPLAYTGGGWGKGVSLDLSTMPTTPMKHAKELEEVWNAFLKWLYNTHIKQIQPTALSGFSKISGKPARIIDCWQYYGGLEASRTHFKEFPKENEQYLYYYMLPDDRTKKHRVQVTDFGCIAITHEDRQYNYHCEQLNPSYAGERRKVCVVPLVDNPEECYIYLEHDPKHNDERVPEPGMVYFIGKGFNHWIRSKADIGKIQERKKNQKVQEKWLKELGSGVWGLGSGRIKTKTKNSKLKTSPYAIKDSGLLSNPTKLPQNTSSTKQKSRLLPCSQEAAPDCSNKQENPEYEIDSDYTSKFIF